MGEKKERTSIDVEKVLSVFKLFLMVWLVKKWCHFIEPFGEVSFFVSISCDCPFTKLWWWLARLLMPHIIVPFRFWLSLTLAPSADDLEYLVKGVSICCIHSKCTPTNNYLCPSWIHWFHFFFRSFPRASNGLFHFHCSYGEAIASSCVWRTNMVKVRSTLDDFNKIIGECFASLFVFSATSNAFRTACSEPNQWKALETRTIDDDRLVRWQ